eukprot:g6505.t1
MAEGGRALLQRSNSISLNVDALLDQLLSVRGEGPNAQVDLPEDDIRCLCLVTRDVLLDQPCLLQLATPMKICGDIHGQYHDLLRLFDYGGHPPDSNYLFLGDYVDRGKRSLETICLLMCYKVKYPDNFFLLRGNHESASINKMYGFYDECKRRYSTKLWRTFTDCFNCLPVAAIVDDKIFCAHGGLSPELFDMEQINRVSRPTDVPDTGLLCDLLWSDPDRDIIGWGENDRGVSFTFGEDIVRDFLAAHDLDLICRAHQVVEDGYEFFAKRRLVTLFSAPNYCGEFNNAGAMMSVDDGLMCSFQILQSSERKPRHQRKSSSANRNWLKKGPGARSTGGAPRSVVDDPLLGPPPGAEDEPQEVWEEQEEAGVLQSLSPETSVPPPTSSVKAVPVAAPVTAAANGYGGSGVASAGSPAAASPAEIAPAPSSLEVSSSTSGSDFDGGPPSLGSLSGGHNRQRAASPPPPPAYTAQEAPTTTEAGASDSDDSPGTSAGGRPLHLPPAAKLVVDEGRIGGSGAGGLEAIPVVRLPPPPATPLSDALATKRLADIDGVGHSAGVRGEKEEAADEPSRSEGFSSGGGGGIRPRRSSHPPAAQLMDDDDDWVNATTGVGGGDKARRRHWLSTAASRRGDGRFASFNGDESEGGRGGRSVSPSAGGNGSSRPPSLALEDASSAAAASGVGANGFARGGGAGSNGRMGMSAAGRGLGHESDPAPAFSSLVPVANGCGLGRGFSKGDVDDKELAVLSSDEDSAETNGTYEMASDSPVDLNADRRLTGGRGGRHAVDWREPSAYSDDDEDAAEWAGWRSKGDRQLEEQRRVAMLQGGNAAATNGGAEHRPLRGEQRRAKARARELATASAAGGGRASGGTSDPVGSGDEIDPAVLPYVAYGLATPPSKMAGSGVDSGGSSSSAGGGGGAGMGVSAKASDRGGDKAGGKSPPVPIGGSAARPLDSMAELFVNHQLQARRPSTEGAAGGAQEKNSSDGGATAAAPAPLSTVDPSARGNKGTRDNGVPDGSGAPFAASAASVDGRAGKAEGVAIGAGIGGAQQLGLDYGGRKWGGGGDSDGGGGEGLDGVEDPNDPSFRRTQSLTTPAAGLPSSRRGEGSPGASPGARSDSEDVQPHRGVRAGKSGRRLAGLRRNFTLGTNKHPGSAFDEDEKGEGLGDLDSSTRSSVWSTTSSKLSDGLRSDSTRSLTESEKRSRREKAARMLGNVKKGASFAWAKVTSDHPDPLPIDKSLTKEEWKAKHYQLEVARRNDWRTNTMGEQYVMQQVLKQEERVWR